MIYADIVRGKLDQKNSRLEVEYTVGRDIKPADVDTIIQVLQDWYFYEYYIEFEMYAVKVCLSGIQTNKKIKYPNI